MKNLFFTTLAVTALVAVSIMGAPVEAAHQVAGLTFDQATMELMPLVGIGGMIINTANLTTLYRSYQSTFQNAFNTAESDWNKIAMQVNSSTKVNEYGWLGSTTRFRKWVGDRVIQNLKVHDYSIKNDPYEDTIGVDRDDIDDDTYGVYSPMMGQLGQDAKTHPDELVFDLLKNGTSKLCYDGQNFFDTDHPVLDANGAEQSVSNTGGGASTAWYLLDMSKVVKPLIFQKRKDYQFVAMDNPDDERVFSNKEFRYGIDTRCNVGFGLWQMAYHSKQDLTAANYFLARTAMLEMKGDNGRPLNLKPMLLVVPPALEQKALTVLKAEKDAAGATNIAQGTADMLMTPWLS